MNCIKYVRPGFGFVPKFPLAKKGDVNGMFEQPIYTFLKVSTVIKLNINGFIQWRDLGHVTFGL